MQASDPYTLLLERVRALEVIVANLRDELAELKAEVADDSWIGGTECDD